MNIDTLGTLKHINIGEPVRPMLERVRDWIANGTDVRIVTARVSHDGSAARMVQAQYALIAIMDWCERHIGKALPVTCVKDYAMKELWDDRVVQVVKNIGHPVGYSPPVL